MRRERLLNLAGILLLLAAWALFVGPGYVALPPLKVVVRDIADLLRSGEILGDCLASLLRVLAGTALATVAAATLTFPLAFRPEISHLFGGIVELLRPIPPLAWVPLAILVFGVGDRPAIAVVTLGAFFPIWLGIYQGYSEVRAQHLLAARSFGATTAIRLYDVVLPSMLPYAFHGLRLGVGLGWFCVVAAELMGSNSGLGYGVQLHSMNLALGKTYAYVLSIAVLGAAMNYMMLALEAHIFRWHRLARGGGD